MKKIYCEVSDYLHREIKVLTAKNQQTIKDYIVNLIKKDLEKRGKQAKS